MKAAIVWICDACAKNGEGGLDGAPPRGWVTITVEDPTHRTKPRREGHACNMSCAEKAFRRVMGFE